MRRTNIAIGIALFLISSIGIVAGISFVTLGNKLQRQQMEAEQLNEQLNLIQQQVDHLCTVVSSVILYNSEVDENALSTYEFEKTPRGDYILCFANYQTRTAIATYYSLNKDEQTRFVRVCKIPKDILDNWPWHGILKIPQDK
ncbi:MAG: hypothetical protein AAB509_03700 [Patescibacteria group bacterium]